MFDLELNFDDILISSIQKDDIILIEQWMRQQMSDSVENNWTNVDELENRFIEYYISENEFFLKIMKDESVVGIFKGRIELKNPKEVLIWCYIIDNSLRGIGMGSKILNNIIKYFSENFGIKHFSTGIVEGSNRALKFWRKNNFLLYRISKNFFYDEINKKDMILLKRQEAI